MKQFFSVFQRLNIQTRLVVSYIIFVVLIMGVMIFLVYHQTAQSLQATTDRATALALARQIALRIALFGLPIAMILVAAAMALARAFHSRMEKLRQSLSGLQSELQERKQAEEKLLQFRRVMDESNDAIFLIDLASGHYLDFNQSAHEILGYSREELAQRTAMDIAQHLPDLDTWLARVELVRKAGSLIFETAYKRKDQSIFSVEVSARLITYGGRI